MQQIFEWIDGLPVAVDYGIMFSVIVMVFISGVKNAGPY